MESDDRNDIQYFKRRAKSLNKRKYQLLGIKDEKLLKRLVDFDTLYFLYMYNYRRDFDENLQKLLDELPNDF